jgi:hypothetical protein
MLSNRPLNFVKHSLGLAAIGPDGSRRRAQGSSQIKVQDKVKDKVKDKLKDKVKDKVKDKDNISLR